MTLKDYFVGHLSNYVAINPFSYILLTCWKKRNFRGMILLSLGACWQITKPFMQYIFTSFVPAGRLHHIVSLQTLLHHPFLVHTIHISIFSSGVTLLQCIELEYMNLLAIENVTNLH